MGDYGRTSGSGGVGSSAITNDDDWTLVLPDQDHDEDYDISKVMDKRAY